MKKYICLFLACMFFVLSFAGCGTKNDNTATGGSKLEYDSIVPEDVKFEGETFSILSREDNTFSSPFQFEVVADETSSDVVNQAVYERNLAVEERFGLEIVNYAIPGQYEVKDDFQNTFMNSILSGAGEYDIILGQQAYMSETGLLNYYYNIYDVPYLKDNLGADYYVQDLVNELNINQKLYYLVSDYNLTYWDGLWVTLFNKQIVENNNIDDLYQLVKDGKWTFDKVLEISKGMYYDLNGDNWAGEEDQFGFIIDVDNCPAESFFTVFDCQPTTKHPDGTVELSIDQGKMVSILDKFITFKNTEDFYGKGIHSSQPIAGNVLDTIFSENRALFYPTVLEKAREFRGMETDFGIIPMPKWNEQQADYYTSSCDSHSVITIPIDCTNLEKVGAVVDVLSAISYSTVLPAYYDVSLKNKYARDNDSSEMLDLIRKNVKMSFGIFFNGLDIGRSLRVLIPQDNANFVSYYASNEKAYQRNLKKILKTFEDHE